MADTVKFFFQHLPERLDPVAFSVGPLDIRWYSAMYLIGFVVVYCLLIIRKKELLAEINQKSKIKNQNNNEKLKSSLENTGTASKILEKEFILDLLLYCFIGLLIGARLGYVLFYDFAYFIKNPLEIILPLDFSCQWSNVNCHRLTGLYGMSYFGGLTGALFAGWVFCRRKNKVHPVKSLTSQGATSPQFNKVNFWRLADFVVPAIPAGYFFGRIGNFLNGELYGRITGQPWGMYFPADPAGALRHPSQLYEAFFEGLVLFAILWSMRNRSNVKGQMLIVYLLGYGAARFFCEFFRQPDPQAGLIFSLTLGQIFSLLAIVLAVCIFIWRRKKKVV